MSWIAYVLPFAAPAGLGFALGWIIPQRARKFVPVLAVVLAVIAFAVAHRTAVAAEYNLAGRSVPFDLGLCALSFAAGGLGWAMTKHRNDAMIVSGLLAGLFILTLPFTALILGCPLMGACP